MKWCVLAYEHFAKRDMRTIVTDRCATCLTKVSTRLGVSPRLPQQRQLQLQKTYRRGAASQRLQRQNPWNCNCNSTLFCCSSAPPRLCGKLLVVSGQIERLCRPLSVLAIGRDGHLDRPTPCRLAGSIAMAEEATAPDFRRTATGLFASSLAVRQLAGGNATLVRQRRLPAAQRMPPMVAA